MDLKALFHKIKNVELVSQVKQLHKPFYIWLQTTGLFLTNKWLKMHYAI